MFNLFKRTRAITKPVIIVTGKIKHNKETNTYSFWPNYAKSNELKQQYNLGYFAKTPCKYNNITVIAAINIETDKVTEFTNGVNGLIFKVEL